MEKQISEISSQAEKEISQCKSLNDLKEVENKFLGKKGLLSELLKALKDLPADQKPIIGKFANDHKVKLEALLLNSKQNLEKEKIRQELEKSDFDITVPGEKIILGHIHPLSQVQREVEEIFSQMGFMIADGPEIESEYYNFEGLNIPEDHPARDCQDTFFIKEKFDEKHKRMVLRTHTSPVQVRSMEKYGAPLRLIVPGRVFRYEATDASHDSTFNQVEGLLIDKNISVAHLKGVMKEFLSRLFGKEVTVRFRPGYFPFVEPGIELDFSCLICEGSGCRVCKHTGWIEFMGSGMVHPNVLKAGGIDSKEYQGWAFGFGITRLVMMKYGISDIRLLLSGDMRFTNQF